jgi:hypothetical protein
MKFFTRSKSKSKSTILDKKAQEYTHDPNRFRRKERRKKDTAVPKKSGRKMQLPTFSLTAYDKQLLKAFGKKIAIKMSIVGGAVGVFIALFVSDWFIVDSVHVRGLERLEEDVIRDIVEDEMEGDSLFIPHRNLLMLSSDAIAASLGEELLFDELRISKQFPNSITIEIKEKTPVLLVKANNGYFRADPEGIVFDIVEAQQYATEADLIDAVGLPFFDLTKYEYTSGRVADLLTLQREEEEAVRAAELERRQQEADITGEEVQTTFEDLLPGGTEGYTSFFEDKAGIVAELERNLNIIDTEAETGTVALKLGDIAIPEDAIELLDFFATELQEYAGVSIVSTHYRERNGRTYALETSEGWTLFVTTELDLRQQLNALRAAFQNTELGSRRPDFSYIDVSVRHRVYWK